ncbi:hypothetical protein AVEN_33575-1 [Araneus ventricosus]|uniref:Uncharacterized protein n=1 Tax=Araneus ventricosus TaxID=182803 RepID=A0A4Y2PVC5_ARAVE|nr:hypothetical protein AVEN_33575-1 [Araneus ventricosus]
MTIPILLAKLRNCCKSSNGKSGVTFPPPYSLDLSPNLGSKHLSGTRFSSKGDVKTAAENWLNGQDVIVFVLQTGTYYNESQSNFYPGNNLNL